MPLKPKAMRSIHEIASLDELTGAHVHTANHCFGCTAGMGSS